MMRSIRKFCWLAALAAVVILVGVIHVHASDGSVLVLAIDPQTPTTIYAGTYGGGVFKSTDGGLTWNAVGPGYVNVSSLLVDPRTPTTVYAGIDAGVIYKT